MTSQLNSEMMTYRAEAEQFQASETDCQEESKQRSSLPDRTCHSTALRFETALKHNELQKAQLRKSCDDNHATLLEYLAQELEEKLQWEENECFARSKVEEMQHDDLVTDLMGQHAALQAEADSLKIEVAEQRNSPPQVGAPLGAGIGELLEIESET